MASFPGHMQHLLLTLCNECCKNPGNKARGLVTWWSWLSSRVQHRQFDSQQLPQFYFFLTLDYPIKCLPHSQALTLLAFIVYKFPVIESLVCDILGNKVNSDVCLTYTQFWPQSVHAECITQTGAVGQKHGQTCLTDAPLHLLASSPDPPRHAPSENGAEGLGTRLCTFHVY